LENKQLKLPEEYVDLLKMKKQNQKTGQTTTKKPYYF
jgi:hypothetical protein